MDQFLNVEGILIENKALSNHELISYIKQLKIKNFRGVFMRDNLPKKKRNTECGIVNLADSLSFKLIGFVITIDIILIHMVYHHH